MLRARSSFVPALVGPLVLFSFVPFAFAACEGAARPGATLTSRRAALGPCGLVVTRLNVDQVGTDDGSREFIELSAPDGVGQTLAACGLSSVGSYEGSGEPGTPCLAEPASRTIAVGDLVVPADGFVVLARGGDTSLATTVDATTSATKEPWLENGPDYLVLSGPGGPLAAWQIGAKPACTLPEGTPVEVLPKDGDVAGGMDKEADEHLIVRCPEGYRGVSWAASPPRSTPVCPPLPPAPSTSASEGGGTAPITPPKPTASATATAPPLPPDDVPKPTLTPPCRVRFDKVDVAQPASGTSTVRDTREAVELYVAGEIPEGATLATCGVTSFAPFRTGSKSQVSLCGDAATSYGEVAIGHIPVPSPPYVLLAQRPDADSPLSVSKTNGLLSNGPDYLALRDERGLIVDAVAYASGAAPTYYPACPGWEKATAIPACEDAAKKGVENQIAVRCPDGSWRAVVESQITFHQAALCGTPSPAKSTTGDGQGGEDDDGADTGAANGDEDEPRAGIPAASGGGAAASPSPRLPLRDSTCAWSPPTTDETRGSGRALALALAVTLLIARRSSARARAR